MDEFDKVVWLTDHAGFLATLRDEASVARASFGEFFAASQTDDVDWIQRTMADMAAHVALVGMLLVDAPEA